MELFHIRKLEKSYFDEKDRNEYELLIPKYLCLLGKMTKPLQFPFKTKSIPYILFDSSFHLNNDIIIQMMNYYCLENYTQKLEMEKLISSNNDIIEKMEEKIISLKKLFESYSNYQMEKYLSLYILLKKNVFQYFINFKSAVINVLSTSNNDEYLYIIKEEDQYCKFSTTKKFFESKKGHVSNNLEFFEGNYENRHFYIFSIWSFDIPLRKEN